MKASTKSPRGGHNNGGHMNRKNSKAAHFGAGIAFVAFLLTGAIPALVYGGYMGLMLSGVLFGHGGDQLIWSRLVTGGGMVLGCVATLFLYLVVGAFLGSMVGATARRLSVEGSVGEGEPEGERVPVRNEK